jgi:hypothetical protein
MIYESLLVPHESPISLTEIKRALITYDKVILIHPEDRKLMPNAAFLPALAGRNAGSFNLYGNGPGEMGKRIGYDEQFERILQNCSEALNQNLLEVRSTYIDNTNPGDIYINGCVPMEGYPLFPPFVANIFYSLAKNRKLLINALGNNPTAYIKELDFSPNLSLEGADLTLKWGSGEYFVEPLPELDDFFQLEKHHLKILTAISQARIASFVKHAGYCEAKDLIPVFNRDVYGGIANTILSNASNCIENKSDIAAWKNRTGILDICHNEFMLDERLEQLSIDDVIKLRSKAWGKHAENREKFFSDVFDIASDIGDTAEFERRATELISKYRETASDLIAERAAFEFNVKCDLAKMILGGGVGAVGLISQLESPIASIGTTLAAA